MTKGLPIKTCMNCPFKEDPWSSDGWDSKYLIMNKVEIKSVEKAISLLKNSAKTNWERGDIEQWSDHAKTMKSTIWNVCSMLEPLLIQPDDVPIKKNSEEVQNDLLTQNLNDD